MATEIIPTTNVELVDGVYTLLVSPDSARSETRLCNDGFADIQLFWDSLSSDYSPFLVLQAGQTVEITDDENPEYVQRAIYGWGQGINISVEVSGLREV